MIADSSISQLIRAYIVANVITLFEIAIYSAFLGLTQNFNTHLHRRFNWTIEVGQGHKNWYQDRDNFGLISDFWISPHVAKPKDVVRFTGHDDVIKWKYFLRYWALDSPPKGQEPGALMFSLMFAGTNVWVNSRQAGDLRRHGTHYDVTIKLLVRSQWPKSIYQFMYAWPSYKN